MHMSKKVALIILDGWGLGQNKNVDAIAQANTPFFDSLMKSYPNTTLTTFGEAVGLPEGQMGNSEVGHLNIGAGRVVYQELQKINNAVKDGTLASAKGLIRLFDYCKTNHKPLHLMGLISDGGVHSHTDHAVAVADLAAKYGLNEIYIHAFLDGRDTDPNAGIGYLKDLIQQTAHTGAKVVSIIGRYYAMDRDKRWERVKKTYDLLIKGVGESTTDLTSAIQKSYDAGITDEFMLPHILSDFQPIKEGDGVFCFNFRTDRCREITQVLTQSNFPEFDMKKRSLFYTTMTIYDETYVGVNTVFNNDKLTKTLGEVLALNHKTQLRAAETEKYPHVTFFFNGGEEKQFEGEHRIMAPSPKVSTYDLQPAMSAVELTQKVQDYIETATPDFVCLNYANTDMVGHTGVFEAVKIAAETVDSCLEKIVSTCLEKDYAILVTADHGNADKMKNEDGTPNTAHSKNPVPFILVDKIKKNATLKAGKLADLAPTILSIMDVPIPVEMNGDNLVLL
jgi:2,3-bisphosphoglycerate-independent phosphoglycerate mutase